jgi:hypothetical protein
MSLRRMTNLALPSRCLAVFVDDTGHEALPDGQPFYGLGGCAALGHDLDRLVRGPWREVRRQITGSPETPLHASQFRPFETPENIEVVAQFFRTNPFARIGAIISTNTVLAREIGILQTIAMTLQRRIAEVARWTAFESVAVVLESSQRADKLIEQALQDFRVEIKEDGKPVPIEFYFMEKKRGEPALEVADFIIHTVGRQARQNLKKRGDFVPDFRAVFHGIDRKLISFIELSSVEFNKKIDHQKSPD